MAMNSGPLPKPQVSKTFKIVMLGDASVGKTHLCSRYTKGTLPLTAQATVGIEFLTKDVEVGPNGEIVRAHIWDTAGQERYRSVTANHYRRAEGALVVYDITKSSTFTHTAQWIEQLRSQAELDICICLVGNKVDLENQREVSTEEGRNYALAHNLLFYETSTCTGKNVIEAFYSTISKVYQNFIAGGGGSSSSGAAAAAGYHPLAGNNRMEKRQYIREYNSIHKGGLKLSNNQSGKNQESTNCCGDNDDDE